MKKVLAGMGVLLCFTLAGCAQESSAPKANGAVIERNSGGSANWEALHTFYDNIKNQRPDSVSVVNYTIEGDPITMEVKYTGERFKFTVDTRQDKFGPHEIRKITCGKLEKLEMPTGYNYEVSDCFGRHSEKWSLLFEPKSH
jgi:hypothetical protein